MIPLLASSVVAFTVIVERLLFWRRLRVQRGGPGILALVAEGDLPQAMQVASASRHPVARVLGAGIAAKHLSPGNAMQASAQAEVSRARRYLPVLDTVIALAPRLGLLGTITGMISAFGVVSEAGLGQPQAITGGIAEALNRDGHWAADRYHDPDPLQLLAVQSRPANRCAGGAVDAPGAAPRKAVGVIPPPPRSMLVENACMAVY